ncbi:hypothetical protein KUCAC02_035718, partial [Chaenocephalus aceratus]
DIRQILTGSTEGKLILESLDEDVIIPSQRKCLVRILVSHLMEKFGESPTSETKKALAAALIHGFPSLKVESDTSSGFGYWFTPGRNHRPATGFLEERLRNVRKRMRKPARSRSTQQTPPQSSEAGTRRTFIPECTISEERAIQCKEWLKHNSQPLNQVEQYMQDTAVYRAKSLRENGWDIQGIRQEFPHLFTPGMIAQDFQILHREAAPKLFETWLPLFKDKILHLARREGKLISSLDGLTPDCLGELALSQLPTLLPPTVYRVGRKVFRYTIEESKLAFIDHKPPTIVNSPSKSSPDVSKPLKTQSKFPHDDNPKPAASTDDNPKPAASTNNNRQSSVSLPQNKDSKPDVPTHIPAFPQIRR